MTLPSLRWDDGDVLRDLRGHAASLQACSRRTTSERMLSLSRCRGQRVHAMLQLPKALSGELLSAVAAATRRSDDDYGQPESVVLGLADLQGSPISRTWRNTRSNEQ